MDAPAIGIEIGAAASGVVYPGPMSDLLPVGTNKDPADMVLIDDIDLVAGKAQRIISFHQSRARILPPLQVGEESPFSPFVVKLS